MSSYIASVNLPYSCEQLFGIAAGIEQYSEFLPGWIDAQITGRSDDRLEVCQSLGFGLLRINFVSSAILKCPHSVHVSSGDGPFKSLEIQWNFMSVDEQLCRVSLDIEMVMKHPALSRLASRIFDTSAQEVMARFCQRAQDLYGKDISGQTA